MERLYQRIFCGILGDQSVESHEVLLSSSTAPKRYLACFSIQLFSKQFLISTIKVSMQEARLAKEKMHGRLACGRPLIVRLASEKYLLESAENCLKGVGKANKTSTSCSSSGQMNRSAKIAAIKNKLKSLEDEGSSAKKQKHDDNTSFH